MVAGSIAALDNVAGDIDTLQGRIAAVRSWSYITQRPDWVLAKEEMAARARAAERGLVECVPDSAAEAVRGADLVILCVPVGAMGAAAAAIAPGLAPGVVVSDVGSSKETVAKVLAEALPGVAVIPAHPVAGTENSGPDAGFASLFRIVSADGALILEGSVPDELTLEKAREAPLWVPQRSRPRRTASSSRVSSPSSARGWNCRRFGTSSAAVARSG